MKPLLALVFALFCAICYSQTVKIADKNFEKALIDLKIDSDETVNGIVLRSDVQSVTSLDLYNRRIKSLKGIEAFYSLTYLDCRKNYLRRLDLSKNINLTTVYSDVNDVFKPRENSYAINWLD
jgi:Leucine-rich repeat (LRR) protein